MKRETYHTRFRWNRYTARVFLDGVVLIPFATYEFLAFGDVSNAAFYTFCTDQTCREDGTSEPNGEESLYLTLNAVYFMTQIQTSAGRFHA
jgi:hypothetical protein